MFQRWRLENLRISLGAKPLYIYIYIYIYMMLLQYNRATCGFKVFVEYLPVSLVTNRYARNRVRPFNFSGFHLLTVTDECPVIDIQIFCGAVD